MRETETGGVVRFDSFRLDLEVGDLSRDGTPVPLRPKAMAVLVALVAAAGRLVPRQRLLRAGWGDSHVDGDTALPSTVREIRQALGDDAADPRYVATIYGRGYRFVASLKVEGERKPTGAEHAEIVREEVDDRPASPAAPGAPPPGLESVGADARSARSERRWIWLAVAAVAVVAVVLVRAPRGADPEVPEAPHAAVLEAAPDVLRARYLLGWGGPDDVAPSASVLREAAFDGGEASSLAWSGLAVAEMLLGRHEQSRLAAERALELRPEDVDAHRVLGQHAAMYGDLDRAEVHLLRALELDPLSGRSHHAFALYLGAAGRLQEAIEMAAAAARMAPGGPVARANLARYRLYARQYGAAAELAYAVLEDDGALGAPTRGLAIETLQAALWARDDGEGWRAAAVRHAEAIGAPAAVGADWRTRPAREGALAALRWRLEHHRSLSAQSPDHLLHAAVVLAQIGEHAAAAEALDRLAGAARSGTSVRIALHDPRLDPLRETAEMRRVLARYGAS